MAMHKRSAYRRNERNKHVARRKIILSDLGITQGKSDGHLADGNPLERTPAERYYPSYNQEKAEHFAALDEAEYSAGEHEDASSPKLGPWKVPHFEFVEYTGHAPNLCDGVLTLRIDGQECVFGDWYVDAGVNPDALHFEQFWASGGCLDAQYNAHRGPWIVHEDQLPEELRPFTTELSELMNENVPWVCCGGCA